MSKSGGFLTPKAIANGSKSKGLQKLKFYCQMCQKQCRDENGFKCHTMSEAHQRQLLLFAENPDKYMDTFSKDFFDGYIGLLSRRFGTKRVQANNVYQEYITERDHVHMNSTMWETLTEFVKWLGREGHAVVDETEKGWFVAWIDRKPETLLREEAQKRRQKVALDDEERSAKFIKTQIDRGAAMITPKPAPEFTELNREACGEKLALDLKGRLKEEVKPQTSLIPKNALVEASKSVNKPEFKKPGAKRKSALEEIIEMERQKKARMQATSKKPVLPSQKPIATSSDSSWLHKGIVVKIVTKKLGEKYYKQKGVVKEVSGGGYTAHVKAIQSGDKLKLDQTHLETVIPAEGRDVLLVNGKYRGEEAILLRLNEKKFSCSVRLTSGPSSGKTLDGIPYEDLCKLDAS